MTKVPLRVYNREIEGMIEGSQLDEAIAHCQHILKTFPMCVETYRLLGKTFLEARKYGDAADIFQRALMAVPDDFVSHVGMSIIRDDEGKLDEAIWHMERAFEIQPSNSAIQGELRRLYGRRDGVEPPKIRLSRDALANMYAQGELFNQAIAEIRAVLADDPNRPDLQVMLARAYYFAGQKVEAAEMAATLLKKYPYCLDALRILVDILPGTTQKENIQIYRHRLGMVDPYSIFSKESVFNSDQVGDVAVNIEKLDYKPGVTPVSTQPEWAASLGIQLNSDKRTETTPEWLQQGDAGEQTSQNSPETAAPAGTTDAVPDWMQAAGWQKSSGSQEEKQPEEFGLETPSEPIAQAEIPDWLKSMAPAGVADLDAIVNNAEETPIPNVEGDFPDWLKGMAPAEQETPAENVTNLQAASPTAVPPGTPGSTPAEEGDVPDWLKSMAPSEAEATPAQATSPTPVQPENVLPSPDEEGDVPDWLKSMAPPDAEATPAQATSPTPVQPENILPSPAEEGDVPDWLKSMVSTEPIAEETIAEAAQVKADSSTPVQPGNVEPSPVGESDLTDWLKTMAPTEPAPAEPKTEASETVVAKPVETIASTPAQPANVEPSPAEEGEIPDWLKSLAPPAVAEAVNLESQSAPVAETGPAKPEELDNLDWLTGTPQPPADKIETGVPAATASAPAQPPEVEMPDWMTSASSESAGQGEPAINPVSPVGTPSPETTPETSAKMGLPDWLAATSSGSTPKTEGVESQPASVEPSPIEASFDASSEIEMPDWLKSSTTPLQATPAPVENPPAASGSFPEPVQSAPASEFEMPDWLKSAVPPVEAETNVVEPVSPGENIPPVEALPAGNEPASAEVADIPDWLKSMAPAAPAGTENVANEILPSEPPAQMAEPGPAEEAVVPDWIKSLAPETMPEAEAGSIPAEPPVMETPPEPAAATDFPDWLKDLNVGPAEVKNENIPLSEAIPLQETQPEKAEEVFPDWLNSMEPEADKQSELEDTRPTPTISLSRREEPMPAEAIVPPEPPPVFPEALTPPVEQPSEELPEAQKLVPTEPAAPAPAGSAGEGSFVPSGIAKPLEIGDDALGWLENLAAKQGANPEELLTKPNEREGSLPDWLNPPSDSTGKATESTGVEVPAEPPSLDEKPAEPPKTPLETMPLPSLDAFIKQDAQRQPLQTLPLTPFDILGEAKPITPVIPPAESAPAAAEMVPPEPKVEETPQQSQPVNIEDDTMAWLERLAANQGAKPEELLSKPEDRPESAPEWVQNAAVEQSAALEPQNVVEQSTVSKEPVNEQPADSEGKGTFEQPPIMEQPVASEQQAAPEQPVGLEPPTTLDQPVISQGPAASVEIPPQAQAEEPEAAQVPAEEDITVTTWLSSLEVEELRNKGVPAETPVEEAHVPQEELPDWLRDMEKPVAPEPTQARVEPESDLPDWLRQPAEPPAQEKMEQAPVLAPVPEPEPEEPMPVWMEEPENPSGEAIPTGPEEWVPMEASAVNPETEPVPEEFTETQPVPEEFVEPIATEETVTHVEATPVGPAVSEGGSLAPIPANNKDSGSLSAAQAALEKNSLNDAMKEYGKLIKKGRLLDEVIHDLREATYRFPVDVIIWQTLGDAYMRANRLQDALDAYTKAEELLR